MKTFSVTITGLIILILSEFVPVEELEAVMKAAGILVTWYGRYRIGDMLPWGVKK